MLKTRDRLVNFRVTQDELDYLKLACAAKGARSVSDFARSAVLRSAADGSDPLRLLESHLAAVDRKLSQIQESLQQLEPQSPRPPLPWKPDGALRQLDRVLRTGDGPAAERSAEAESADTHC